MRKFKAPFVCYGLLFKKDPAIQEISKNLLIGWLVGWLVDWLAGRLAGWLAGRLAGWLAG